MKIPLRRYAFTGFSISLGGNGGNNVFRCNGDIFTKIENNLGSGDASG